MAGTRGCLPPSKFAEPPAFPGKRTLAQSLRGLGAAPTRERIRNEIAAALSQLPQIERVQPALASEQASEIQRVRGELDDASRPATIAAAAVEGQGASFPFFDQIQASFGRHDISQVRAHVGGAAAEAARELGASAFAFGDRIVFADAPDLHTAAHEAVHVIQQRAGVHLAAGIDQPGDVYEQQANEIANLVVRGESAEQLLARIASAGASRGPAVVQRQSSPGAGIGAGSAARTISPGPVPGPELPPSRTATWEQVYLSANDATAQQSLDIEWINDIAPHLRNSIDVEFSDHQAETKLAKTAKVDPELKRLDADHATSVRALRAAVAARLTVKATSPKVDTDPDFMANSKRLTDARDLAKAAHLAKSKRAQDASVAAGKREQSVTNPSTPQVQRLEGRALARTNFMSWAIHVTGSAAAAKQHFLSAYAAADAKAVQALIKKLADPKKIFGAGVKRADGHWGTQVAVTEVSVMQHLERGFIRNDAMPARTGKEMDGKQQVFNAEVATTLARFGWSPGATFGDTMHFDFIEGYSLAIPGGQGKDNMKHTRFSPEGDLPPPAPRPAKAKRP